MCLLLSGCAAGTNWSVFGDKPKVSVTGKETSVSEPLADQAVSVADEDDLAGSSAGEDAADMGSDESAGRLSAAAKNKAPAKPLIVHAMDGRFVVQRLGKYSKTKGQWNMLAAEIISLDKGESWPAGWHKCVQDVEMLNFGYQRLRDVLAGTLINQELVGQEISPWDVLTRDIAYSESNCDDLQEEARKRVGLEIGSYAARSLMQPVDLFRQYMAKHQYPEAVMTYQGALLLGASAPEAATRLEYGRALCFSGRYADAVKVFGSLLDDDFAREDVFMRLAVQRQYADLLLAVGEKEQAGLWYEKIADYIAGLDKYGDWAQDQLSVLSGSEEDLADYQQILKAFYRFDGTYLPVELAVNLAGNELVADDAVQRSINRLRADAADRSLTWFKQQLDVLDNLVSDQDYATAKLMVAELKKQSSGAMLEQMQMMEEHISQSEEFDLQNMQQLQEQTNETAWQQAVRAFDNKKYDTAIRLFAGLMHGERQEDARGYIVKASDLAASELRRRAASLFAKARRNGDPLAKERLLTESRDLLQSLLGSYPEAAIVEKAEKNLQVIEVELQKLKSVHDPLPDDEW